MHRLWVMVAVVLVLAACSGDPDTTTTTEAASATTTTSSTTTTSVPTASPGDGDGDTTTTTAVTTTIPELRGLAWEEVADLGGFITGIEPVGDEVLVARKDGRLTLVADDGTAEVVADLGPLVRDRGEAGLLDTALHPDGDRLFVHYSDRAGDTVLAELPWPVADAEPTILYAVAQPAGNHNGGSIEFGPDGRLHLALGDGGGANDQFGQGQRADTPLAAIHRFDVDTPGVATAPPDNPFPDGEVPSLWVYGVRNPWRIAFDGDLAVIADVGQNRWEEVTVLSADDGGANLGWPIMEARSCFGADSCDQTGLELPAVAVGHGDAGTCSITGGEVYRGDAIPELVGHYVFTDFCGGWLRSFPVTDGLGDAEVTPTDWDAPRLANPAVIAAGPDGELLAGGGDGRLLRLVPQR